MNKCIQNSLQDSIQEFSQRHEVFNLLTCYLFHHDFGRFEMFMRVNKWDLAEIIDFAQELRTPPEGLAQIQIGFLAYLNWRFDMALAEA